MNMNITTLKYNQNFNHCEDFPQYMEIWSANLPLDAASSLTGGRRPIIIISNNQFNKCSDLVLIIPLTAKIKRLDLPTHVLVTAKNLQQRSMALCEQIRTLDQSRLLNRIGCITVKEEQEEIKHALALQMLIQEQNNNYPQNRTTSYTIPNNPNKYNARKADYNHDERKYF